MPSGHAETVIILCVLLYLNNYISCEIAYFTIFITCLQRIISLMHTFNQVIIGCILGLIMTLIYYKLGSFIYCLLFLFIYLNILLYLIIKKIDDKINEPIPKWVDKSLYNIIEKKRNINYIYKLKNIIGIYIYMIRYYFVVGQI